MNFYEFCLILEGQAEDFVNQNPELQPAYDQGVKNINYLRWLLKAQEQEPLEDIIPLVFAFEKNKVRLPIKDIFQYNSPGSLRQDIENLGQSKSKAKEEFERHLKDNETTKIGEFGEWIVVMPHTTESSCQWGKGTTWCTTATQSGNLFLNYAARKEENIVLYYLIKKGADSIKDPNAKISIGFLEGEPDLTNKDGGLTVNAKNQGLNESKLRLAIGDQYDNIMEALKKHSESIKGTHPAKQQMQELASSNDVDKVISRMRGMKEKEKEDFLAVFLEYDVSTELLKKLIEKNDQWIKKIIAHHTKNPEILSYLYNTEEEPSVGRWKSLRAIIAANQNTPLEIREKLSEDKNEEVRANVARWIRFNTGSFAILPENTLLVVQQMANKLVKDKSASVRRHMVYSTLIDTKQFLELTKDIDDEVRLYALNRILTSKFHNHKSDLLNSSQADEVLIGYARDHDINIRLQLAQSSKAPKRALEILAQDNEEVVRDAAKQELSGSKVKIIRMIK